MDLDFVVRQFGLTEPEAVHQARAAQAFLFSEVSQEPAIPPTILAKAVDVDSPEAAAKLATEARKALVGHGAPLQPLLTAAQNAVGAAQYGALPEYRAEVLRRLTASVGGLVTRVGGMDDATARGHGVGAQAQSEYLYANEEARAVRDLFNALMFALEVAPLGVLDWDRGSPQHESYSWFAAITELTPDLTGFETACKIGGTFAGQSVEAWHEFVIKAREHGVKIAGEASAEAITAKVNAWHEISETHDWNRGRQELFPKAGVRTVAPERIRAAVTSDRRRKEEVL